MMISDIGRFLLVIGGLVVVVCLALLIAGRLGLSHVPGDLSFGRRGFRIYIPLGTSLLVSVIATLVLNLLFWKQHRL